MQLLKKVIHPHIESFDGKIFKRVSARGVIEKDGKILLMYTKRYNDYTFPGGGVDSEEHLHEGLIKRAFGRNRSCRCENLKRNRIYRRF